MMASVLRVDRGQRLVEDQDRRIAQQGAGDRQPLPLSSRQVHPPLAEHGLVALRQLPDKIMRIGVARGGFEFLLGRLGFAETQVFLNRAVEQVGVLVDDRDLGDAVRRRPQRCVHVLAADPHCPRLRIEQPQQQAGDRGFAGAARPDNADLLAGRDGEGQPVMRRPPAARIGEEHIVEFEGGREPPPQRTPAGGDGGDSGIGGNQRLRTPAMRGCRRRRIGRPWPWCRTAERRSRRGRNTSVPAIKTISRASIVIAPCETRQDAEPESEGSADRDAGVGDAARHDAGRQHPHRGLAQIPRTFGKPLTIGGALAERLEGRATPCTESRNSAPNPFIACCRARPVSA